MYTSLWGAFNVVCFNIIVFLTLMAHTRAVFSDPGTVPLPETNLDFSDALRANKPTDDKVGTDNMVGRDLGMTEQGDWTICSRCETYRPPRAHHCRICQRCIRRMDHHCPWINNCVGEQNQKYFIQFLLYVGLGCLYIIVLVAVSWNLECPHCIHNAAYKQNRVIHSVCLLVESILFGIFVIAIMCDQSVFQGFDVFVLGRTHFLLQDTPNSKVHTIEMRGIGWPNILPPEAREIRLTPLDCFLRSHRAGALQNELTFQAILSDETAIEQMQKKGPFRARKPKMALLSEVCGRGSPLLWLFPCDSAPKNLDTLSYDV
ncbi:hypothetical protein V5799_000095 [Amblyomma americanum]|uniref:Palmitoyltransferase n=1 Tax=Amblyomma americanum TaxID=6943 RepID=A0AAQ4D413_AMBAM